MAYDYDKMVELVMLHKNLNQTEAMAYIEREVQHKLFGKLSPVLVKLR